MHCKTFSSILASTHLMSVATTTISSSLDNQNDSRHYKGPMGAKLPWLRTTVVDVKNSRDDNDGDEDDDGDDVAADDDDRNYKYSGDNNDKDDGGGHGGDGGDYGDGNAGDSGIDNSDGEDFRRYVLFYIFVF